MFNFWLCLKCLVEVIFGGETLRDQLGAIPRDYGPDLDLAD